MLGLTFSSKLDWGSYIIYFGRCTSELAQLVLLPYSSEVILIVCMTFLSPSLDVKRMSMSTFSFLDSQSLEFSAYRTLSFDL